MFSRVLWGRRVVRAWVEVIREKKKERKSYLVIMAVFYMIILRENIRSYEALCVMRLVVVLNASIEGRIGRSN